MRLFTPFLLALSVATATAAAAAEVTASYSVDVGPLTVTEVKLNLSLGAGAAHAKARIRAAGMSRAFSEFSATAEGESRLDGAAPEPVRYSIARDQSDMRKVTTVSWTDGASPPSYEPGIKNAERKARLEEAMAGGVVDPVTAVLRMGTAGESPCPSTHRVFDGREIYELALTDKGRGQIAGGSSLWQGEVQHCVVRWTPIAGRAKEKGVPGDSYDVDFAPVASLDDGRKLWLPVLMSGSLKGLGFTGYLTRLNDKAASAE